MKFLIVNGDDFGASGGVNRGILEAHRRGILTSTSLLVDGPASADAARLARNAPALSVGLHADVGHGGPGASATALRDALELQLARFEALVGRPPTHLDAHHNVHRDAALRPGFVAFARAHGLALREHSPVRYVSSFYAQWGGATHLEQVGVAHLAHMLATEVRDGITELACHPGYADAELESGYRAEREAELRTLCDPSLPAVLATHAIRLVSYHDLERLVKTLPA